MFGRSESFLHSWYDKTSRYISGLNLQCGSAVWPAELSTQTRLCLAGQGAVCGPPACRSTYSPNNSTETKHTALLNMIVLVSVSHTSTVAACHSLNMECEKIFLSFQHIATCDLVYCWFRAALVEKIIWRCFRTWSITPTPTPTPTHTPPHTHPPTPTHTPTHTPTPPHPPTHPPTPPPPPTPTHTPPHTHTPTPTPTHTHRQMVGLCVSLKQPWISYEMTKSRLWLLWWAEEYQKHLVCYGTHKKNLILCKSVGINKSSVRERKYFTVVFIHSPWRLLACWMFSLIISQRIKMVT